MEGLRTLLADHVLLTGGLAGDGAHFESTVVGLNQTPDEGKIVLIGFCGCRSFSVSYGSIGGWDLFEWKGASQDPIKNVLYELDDKPALDVYRKRYLGDYSRRIAGFGIAVFL